jgi:predicted S18 family serine protease
MKAIFTAVMLVLIAAGPTFAASSHTRHVQERRNSVVVSQSGQFGGADTSRENMVRTLGN